MPKLAASPNAERFSKSIAITASSPPPDVNGELRESTPPSRAGKNSLNSSAARPDKPVLPSPRLQRRQQSLQAIKFNVPPAVPTPSRREELSRASFGARSVTTSTSTMTRGDSSSRRVYTTRTTTLEEHESGLFLPTDMSGELIGLNVKLDKGTAESLESTRRMLSYCEESKEAGIKTLVMLDDQGEQLERVEGNLDTINADMREAEDHLKGMEKFCGLCVLPCLKGQDFEKNSEYAKTWKRDDDGGVISDQPRITVGDSGMGPQGGYITRIQNDAREDEMDENMQQVSTMVGNLRNMAIDMSTEVSNQNRQLDRIQEKAQSNEARVDTANKRTTKLLTK